MFTKLAHTDLAPALRGRQQLYSSLNSLRHRLTDEAKPSGWGVKQLLGDGEWSEQAKAYLRKYEANWDASKVSTNPVFFGGFTATLKQEIPSDELLKWRRQELTWDEIEAVLFKITRRLVAGGRKPCRIPRRYLEKAWTEIGPKIGRKLNNSKIGYITNLLVRYGFITKRRGHKKPSLYGLGENNPFKEGLEF